MGHHKIFFIIFSLFVSVTVTVTVTSVTCTCTCTSVVDFCVADLGQPGGPAGYPCKNPAKVTVDDFVFSGLSAPGNMSNVFKLGLNSAIDLTFPGVNGLGISMIRADVGVGGAVPIHSHRVSELIFVVEGTITSGFIGSDSKAYYKTLNKGDVMIIPQSLFHFLVNIGKTNAIIIASWNSANPGIHTLTTSIAANDIPVDVIQKTTLLDAAQIQKLKQMFGGK